MTRELDLNSPIDPEDLVAYLDGEVDAHTRQGIERCLAQDPQLLQRMREHQQAWDLLDELPRDEVSAGFAQTTLQMVAVAAADDVKEKTGKADTRRTLLRIATGASLIAATFAGFWTASLRLEQTNRELLEDLPVIEHLEAFQQVESVEFLRALENEGLFVAEVSDDQ